MSTARGRSSAQRPAAQTTSASPPDALRDAREFQSERDALGLPSSEAAGSCARSGSSPATPTLDRGPKAAHEFEADPRGAVRRDSAGLGSRPRAPQSLATLSAANRLCSRTRLLQGGGTLPKSGDLLGQGLLLQTERRSRFAARLRDHSEALAFPTPDPRRSPEVRRVAWPRPASPNRASKPLCRAPSRSL